MEAWEKTYPATSRKSTVAGGAIAASVHFVLGIQPQAAYPPRQTRLDISPAEASPLRGAPSQYMKAAKGGI